MAYATLPVIPMDFAHIVRHNVRIFKEYQWTKLLLTAVTGSFP